MANFQEVTTINKVCPGNHKHAAWGIVKSGRKKRFATSLEVHYPTGLCEAIVQAFILKFINLGLAVPQQPSTNAGAQAFSGVLPTSSSVQLFLPEFKSKLVVIFAKKGIQIWPPQRVATSSAKLLSSLEIGGDGIVNVQELQDDLKARCAAASVPVSLDGIQGKHQGPVKLQIYGVYWTVEEFAQRAKEVEHPLSAHRALPAALLETVESNVRMDQFELAKLRAQFVAKWTQRAKELETEERQLKEGMEPFVARAMAKKRLCLFKEMLQAHGYPDLGVVDELASGANLVGNVSATGMLPQKFQPALLSVDELRRRSALVREVVMAQSGSSGDDSLDEQVWAKTMEEVDQGWLEGPLDECSVEVSTPLSRRFGLCQKKDKVRLIDDYSESGVNSCVGTEESPALHTVDVACAMLTAWFSLCGVSNVQSELATRTFDLTSAYRQIGLSSEGRQFSYLRVYCPKSASNKIFRSTVLPFGAVRSVHTFLRCARAIWWLGVVGCKLMWTSFYDDFICFSQKGLERCTELTIVSLFKLLGWEFAESGDKCQPFDNTCSALGVLISLTESSAGLARIHNTRKRIEELCEEINRVVKEGKLSMKAAQRLRGRMQFADSQIWGKTGRRCMRTLREFACGYRMWLNRKDVFFLERFKSLLTSDCPRMVKSPSCDNILVFTDACYEKDSDTLVCGLGGVILFPFGDVRYFAVALSEQQREILGEGKKKQIIFEAETLTALLAIFLWRNCIVDSKCVFFVDNEGCKFALLKGLSENAIVDMMAEMFIEMEDCVNVPIWLARVPSKSNLADEPSRFELQRMIDMKAMDCSSDAATQLDTLLTKIERGVTDS